ncbi:Phospholipase D, C-terminal [Sesbania bispinosa]|nr:Phospholipase D, C-terminal [Sesbania bispinosa]
MVFRILFLFLAFMVTNSAALTGQQTYIVHIDKTKIRPSIHSQDSTKPWFESIIDFISEASMEEEQEEDILPPQLLYAYETSMFGFAAQLSEKQLKYLNQVDGFLSAIPDELLTLHTTYTPQFLGLRNGKGLWSAPNLATDVIIGLLDSGIWPEHISFKDSGLSPVPHSWKDYRSPRDSQGHGTHTASTAAGDMVKNANLFGLAKGSASGMRYTSRIAAYKVCWRAGCANSDVLAAMDQAVSDGVDVLKFRSFCINSWKWCPWIMTVAASYTDRSFPTKVKLGNGKTFEGTSLYQGKQTNQLPLAYGKSAGINSRTEKGEEVKMAGGAGMILINSENQGEELLSDPHILPATSLGASAAFSSRGPSIIGPDVIKPDVTAPGVNILAAWPSQTSPSLLMSDKRRVLFNIISGTSMSCPHVSGIAALLKSVHKDWSPAAIKSALMTTAYTMNNKGAPISDLASNHSAFANPLHLVQAMLTQKVLLIQVIQAGDLNYPSFAVLFGRSALNASVTYKRVVTNVGKPQSVYAVKVEQPNGVLVTVEPRKLQFQNWITPITLPFWSIGIFLPPPHQAPSSAPPTAPYSYHLPPSYPYPYHIPPGSHSSPSPRPSLSHHPSLPHGSSHYYYQQNEAYSSHEDKPGAHMHANSFSGPYWQETPSSTGGEEVSQTSIGSKPSQNSAYPPLDDLMNNVQLSDNQPSAPASPPAPAVQPLMHSMSVPKIQQKKEEFYGYSNNSFSGWGSSYPGQVDSSKLSEFSGSFNESVHSQSLQIVPMQNKGSLRVLLLHGNLDIWVLQAKNLPNMDMFHKTLGDMFGRLPGNVSNKIEGTVNRKITSDPYVSISVSNAVIGRTFVISNNSDVVGSQLIGIVAIPVEQIYSGEKVEGTYPILNNNGKPCKQGAVLSLSIQYIPMERLSIYHQGVGAGPEYIGVPGTYFPLRKGGAVTLYQDAHVPDGTLPNVLLDNGTYYVHGKCWHDIFHYISQARRLIYITGWSVWHKVRLVRDAGYASDYTLGDLLRSKSQEGVRVLLLLWDDPTSRSILGYKTDGVMATHDEETRRFFKHSSVHVLLCPRIAGKRHSWIKQKGNVGGCPREPWHDLHSRIDGPAAYDVLTNFEERWLKASKPHGIKKLKISYDDALLRLERIPDVIGMTDLPCPDDDPEAWHVQIFRSIDSNSVKGFPKNPREATGKNLVCGKNVLIDMSIHTAYVKAIRAAQHYIYIENQYFIGSSFNWNNTETWYRTLFLLQTVIYAFKNCISFGANNLIPMEIALKIAEKIKANERFAVYIVIPMWPEGVPTGAATQRILFWQAASRNNRRFMIYVHSKGMIVDDEYVYWDLQTSTNALWKEQGTVRLQWEPTNLIIPGQENILIHTDKMSLWAEHTGTIDDCFLQPESLECVRRIRSMGEINWQQFSANEVTEMRGHLLKYPVEVDRKGKVRPLPGYEEFPDVGGKIVGSFLAMKENLTI